MNNATLFKIFLLNLCAFSFIGCSTNKGLVAWYHLDGNADDSSGYSNHGKVMGKTDWVNNGKLGKGCIFDGHSAVLVKSEMMPEKEYTISGWIIPGEIAREEVWRNWIMIPSDQTFRETSQFELGLGDGRKGDGNGPLFLIWDHSSTVVNIRNTAMNARDEKWHHMAVTYKSGEQILYFDGIKAAESDYRGRVPRTSSDIHIGGASLGIYHKPWIGGVDEVRIYNRVLSAKDIKAMYKRDLKKLGDMD